QMCIRERNKVGLIIIGGCAIDDTGAGPLMISLEEDSKIQSHKELCEQIHKTETKIFAQLYHAGRYSHSFLYGKRVLAPSPIPSRLTGITPEEMTEKDIDAIVKAYAEAARRAKIAGYDGVEIIASAGYLICQFLSPLTNKRTDRFGGSLENRFRFAKMVIENTRQAVGNDFPLIIRMSGYDFMPVSPPFHEMIEIAKLYEQCGVDAINVTGGWHESSVPQITGHLPPAGFKFLSKMIKDNVKIPVFLSNRINEIDDAESLIAHGYADIINFGRQLITDPEMPIKVYHKRYGEIRPCIACNQECLDNVFNGLPVGCTVNPNVGYEGSKEKISEIEPKNIAVIGAGVAGLECAVNLAKSGHTVTVYEENNYIGGQLVDASSVPGKEDYKRLVRYYQHMIDKYAINLILNKRFDLDELDKNHYDFIVLATGSVQYIPDIPYAINENSVLARFVLTKRRPYGNEVVIVGGNGVGLDTALFIASSDTLPADMTKFLIEYDALPLEEIKRLATQTTRRITVLDMDEKFGRDIGRSTRWIVISSLKRLGVKLIPRAKVVKIDKDGVYAEIEGKEEFFPAQTVVLAMGAKPNNKLESILKERDDLKYFVIGDAKRPSNITNAIKDGYNTAKEINRLCEVKK
ncbi:MAG: FAD-dependent oxidoreductase, partial [Deltaproteobacteria bacterium]|nr:FAD-dependent oxidoreductase [Deltaproteobacteria bacterium]